MTVFFFLGLEGKCTRGEGYFEKNVKVAQC